MTRRYDGVLFDLGGTLFEHLPRSITDANLTATIRELAADTGRSIEISQAIATYRQCRHSQELARLSSRFFLHRQVVLDAFSDTLEKLALPGSDQAALSFYERQRSSVISGLQLRPETRPTLEALREQGCYLGIVSNIDNDYFQPLLDAYCLPNLMEHCLSSETAQSCKPHSGIFVRAIEASELPAERLLYVGDSPAHDVAGARNLGMATAWLATGAPTGADQKLGASADFRIDSLAELISIVGDG